MTTTTQAAPRAEAFNLAEELWTAMENGVAPWMKTWKGGEAPGRPANVISGKAYRSGNSLYLQMLSMKNGWSNRWISFIESSKMGGNLQGERGTKIEVPLIKKQIDVSTGVEKEFLRGFRAATVFNVDQVKGIDIQGQTPSNPIESVASVERMLDALKLQGLTYVEPSQNGGCWYLPAEDKIGMPLRASFTDSYEFYSSLAHEMSHSTIREGRVERDKVSYGYEELRAEIAATMICSSLNLPRTQAQVDNHTAYLQPWLEEFSDKKQFLLKACSEGQAIHDYLIGLTVTP
jgi:antirestriction protein ArdC